MPPCRFDDLFNREQIQFCPRNNTNLFDKEYYTIMDWYSTYTWGEPRSTMLTMNYKF